MCTSLTRTCNEPITLLNSIEVSQPGDELDEPLERFASSAAMIAACFDISAALAAASCEVPHGFS